MDTPQTTAALTQPPASSTGVTATPGEMMEVKDKRNVGNTLDYSGLYKMLVEQENMFIDV